MKLIPDNCGWDVVGYVSIGVRVMNMFQTMYDNIDETTIASQIWGKKHIFFSSWTFILLSFEISSLFCLNQNLSLIISSI